MVLIHRPRPPSDPFYSSRSSDYSQAYLSILRASRSKSIGSTSSSASAAVLILVAPDVDALCAARLFAKLLREDDVPYRVVPVDGYRTLNKIIVDDVVGNPELHSLLFINLGSILSLPNYFESSSDPSPEDSGAHPLPDHCTVHVIDSHRPWNLDNLFASSTILQNQIWIWDDGEVQERLQLEQEAYSELEFDRGDESESDSEDESESESGSESGSESEDESEKEDEEEEDQDQEEDEDEFGSPSKKKVKKRKRRNDDGSDEDEDLEEGAGKKSRKRKHRRRHRSKPKKLSRAARIKYRNVLGRYYSRGAATGTSVAGMIYMLAAKLGRGDNDALWLAILGLTAQYVSSSIHFEDYDIRSKALSADVEVLNPRPSNPRGSRAHVTADYSVSSTSADDAQIRVLDSELRFTLYRHWSLEHSMYHTSYVAAKLGIWREKGMSKLRGLLAKMGFSLQNCRQHYEHMDLDLRATLVAKMDDIAPEYGLTELTYRSFIRSFGFLASPISAADAVEGIHALLNAAYGVRIDVETPGMTFAASNAKAGAGTGGGNYGVPGNSGSELFGQKKPWRMLDNTKGMDKENDRPQTNGRDDLDDDEKTRRVEQDRDEAWKNCFHAAYGALDSKKASSVALLSSSLALSKSLHAAVISQGVSLIDKQAIRTLAGFRLAIIKDGPDLHLFSHPSTLTRLALWLVDALRDLINETELKKAKNKRIRKLERAGKQINDDDEDGIDPNAVVKNLPFVIAALDEETDVFVVVGVTGAPDFGDTRRNRFGLSFQEAARRSGARTRHDRFETAAIEVRKEDIGSFVEHLHLEA